MLSNLKYSIILLAIFLVSTTKNPPKREFKITGQAQGTTYGISYFAADSIVSKRQIDSILNVIDLSMSLYKPQSTINKFNQMPKGRLKLDVHMRNVLEKSFQINQETKGLFDVAILQLMRLWGFYSENGKPIKPDTGTIRKSLKHTMFYVGMDKIKLRKNYLSKQNNHVEIDLNGIAQGYTVDVMADFIESKGITAYIAELGGEIRAKGPKPDGKPIKIGIERPPTVDLQDNGLTHIVSFKEGAITTSGDYRKFIVFDGKKYGHIINPKTGYPINNEIMSVTVFAKKAMDADGYDNALMLMTVEKALKFVAEKKDLEAYIIYKKPNGIIADTLTNGFRDLIIP
ncbi:MAG: FAD:protein FMN transferase [Pedobacter sp.]|nr:MAG: FAD:protein FMN transferase [Pedobacter sp.]